MEPGGRASKLGGLYERLWAVYHALMVIDGRLQSIQWEPVGDDGPGVDLWVTENNGQRVGHQLKRQNQNKEYWSISDLRKEGVLDHAFFQLERDLRAKFVFVSSCGVRSLRDLAEQSHRANDDPEVFFKDLVSVSNERKRDFEELMRTWKLDAQNSQDIAHAFGLLQRMEVSVQERSAAERKRIEFQVGAIVAGDPSAIVAVIGDYLDSNLGKAVHADELRNLVAQRGFQIRKLAGDPSLPAAIEGLQTRFNEAISSQLIAGVPIDRPEVAELLSQIGNSDPPQLILVHGAAGSGKSVVLHQLFKVLTDQNVPCLPVQLHFRRPEGTPLKYGCSKLDLPASPAQSLRGLADARRAVMILDQLDALRLTSNTSHEAWEACAAMIDEALGDHRTTTVVACRTFDLNNDPNIESWRRSKTRQSNSVVEVEIKDLPEQAVSDLLKKCGTDYGSLPDRQKKLLRIPVTLALWWNLASAGCKPAQFTHKTQRNRSAVCNVREAVRVLK